MTDVWPTIPFAVSDLDRADARRREPGWLSERVADPRSLLLVLWRGRPLVDAAGALALLPTVAAADLIAAADPLLFLGLRADDRALFAVNLGDAEAPAELVVDARRFVEARAAAATLSLAEAGALAQARSLAEWHRHHPFCARCGAATEAAEAGYKRRCTVCAAEHFPRTDPVVIMLVHRGDRCLLGRQPRFPPGLFTCLAGFVEPGETVEDAVRREVREEAGITCGAVRYRGSQPWPFPSQLMLACEAEATDEEICVDRHELEEARWFSRAQLRSILDGDGDGLWIPPAIAVAHHLIATWARGAKA
ncbi:MAG: NAD(+) diphosphatase [Nannocystaceae bacterium]